MPALLVEDLHKRYGSFHALRGISFQVPRGSIYGLIGPNGSGKTTTLSCLLNLRSSSSGRVEVLGVNSSALHQTDGRVGAVFDAPTLAGNMSVLGNLQYAKRLLGHRTGRSPSEALKLVGAQGLERQLGRELSMGQARRVAIARALLGSPELIILDEPLAGLDTPGVRDMLTLFRSLREEGLTLVLSSHRMHELEEVVDRVAILMKGQLAREGSLAELLGEDRDGLHLRARPAALVHQTLNGLDAVRGIEQGTLAGDWAELRAVAAADEAPAIARALIEAGCELASILPERRSLQSLFESLLDEQEVGA